MNTQLAENNYIIINNFISLSKAKSLAEQFNTYCAEYDVPDDPQVLNSQSKYDFIPFVELLVEKNEIVGKLVGENVLPTYSYARIYRHGNILPGHVDKCQCEISLTVNLECDNIWDIWIETPKGKKYVSLGPGDAMLYLGMEGMHGREPFNGESCTQVFLHYVRSDGPYFRTYFDKKQLPTENKVKMNIISSSINSNVKKTSESSLSEYIKVYDSVFTPEECKTILDEYKNSDEWVFTRVGATVGIVDKDTRNCQVINLSDETIIGENPSVRKNIDELIHKNAISAALSYTSEFPLCTLRHDSGYNLLKYETGGFYKQHTDSYKDEPRTLAMSINLNDDYEGGSIAFFDEELDIRGGLGSVIVFPANFMYPHQIKEVTKGIRYSIVTWLI